VRGCEFGFAFRVAPGAIHVPTVENDNFRKELDKRRSSAVTACRRGGEPRDI
jgi:hypothetical protein